MKKILIIPDSFKETLSGYEVSKIIKEEFLKVYPCANIIALSMADGGEGTIDTLIEASEGYKVEVETYDPLLRDNVTYFGISGDKKTAFIEMAKTSGIELLQESEKNPLLTTSYGTGELILRALDEDVEELFLCIGGSATNEAGLGMLEVLGAKFLDKNNNQIKYISGSKLKEIVKIDTSTLDKRLKSIKIQIACDVDNLFYGETGASKMFGPQKGASNEMVNYLEEEFIRLNNLFINDYHIDLQDIPGSGAAGGMGGILKLFLNGEIKSGAKLIGEYLKLDELIKDCDLVITGEGAMDQQTMNGKAPYYVAQLANKYSIPVIGICGKQDKDADVLYENGFDAIFSIMQKPQSFEEAKEDVVSNIQLTAKAIANTLKLNRIKD